MPNRAVRSLCTVLLLAVGCSALGVVASQPTATMEGVTRLPSSLPPRTAPAASASATAGTPTPVAFPVPRAAAHLLVFSNSDEVAQTIYAYDYEAGDVDDLLTLPSRLSGHSQGINPRLGPNGMYLSPDAYILVAIEAGTEQSPSDYLHQIDLATGEIGTLKLSERGKWTLPVVAGRDPGEDVERESPFLQNAYSNVFFLHTLVWAPDSSGLVFTLGDDSFGGPDGDVHYDGQMYYMERGSTEVVPLGAEAPGNHVGFGAAWSPRSHYLTYVTHDLVADLLWLIDMQHPEDAFQVFESIDRGKAKWLSDESSIVLSAAAFLEAGSEEILWHVLARYDLSSKAYNYLRRDESPGSQGAGYELVGETADGAGFVVVERAEVDGQSVPGRDRLLNIDLTANEAAAVIEGEALSHALVLPQDRLVWVVYDERREGAIVEVPSGKVVAGPGEWLYPPSKREGIETSPAWASDAFDEGRLRWTPDMHLLAGYVGDDIVIWDVQTGEFTTVAPDLKGYKVLLGWDPTP